jgi:hypothetical protein
MHAGVLFTCVSIRGYAEGNELEINGYCANQAFMWVNAANCPRLL